MKARRRSLTRRAAGVSRWCGSSVSAARSYAAGAEQAAPRNLAFKRLPRIVTAKVPGSHQPAHAGHSPVLAILPRQPASSGSPKNSTRAAREPTDARPRPALNSEKNASTQAARHCLCFRRPFCCTVFGQPDRAGGPAPPGKSHQLTRRISIFPVNSRRGGHFPHTTTRRRPRAPGDRPHAGCSQIDFFWRLDCTLCDYVIKMTTLKPSPAGELPTSASGEARGGRVHGHKQERPRKGVKPCLCCRGSPASGFLLAPT